MGKINDMDDEESCAFIDELLNELLSEKSASCAASPLAPPPAPTAEKTVEKTAEPPLTKEPQAEEPLIAEPVARPRRKTAKAAGAAVRAEDIPNSTAKDAPQTGSEAFPESLAESFAEPPTDQEAKGEADKPSKEKKHYHGHRQRLRDKFLKAAEADSLAGFADYELLELLLFLAIPQRDVRPLAKETLARFGSLGAVLSARPHDLMTIPGIKDGAAVAIKVAHAAALHMLRGQVMDKPVLSSWDQVLHYCHASMAYRDVEQFRLLFLDRRNRLIADELQHKGTIDRTSVYPREVVKRALELQASALIMVHNHPSGDPQPSRSDIDITKRVAEALRHVDVALHDHLVISRTGYCSFKSDGLL